MPFIYRQMAFLILNPRTSRLTHPVTSIACHVSLEKLSRTRNPCRACIQEKEEEGVGLGMPNYSFYTLNSPIRFLKSLLPPGGLNKEAKRSEEYHLDGNSSTRKNSQESITLPGNISSLFLSRMCSLPVYSLPVFLYLSWAAIGFSIQFTFF